MSGLIHNLIITSPYGPRVLPNGDSRFHDGIDFKSTTNDRRVFSPEAGICVFDFDDYEDRKRWTDNKHSGGNYTIIKTKILGVDYYIKYLHLVENYVSKGQIIHKDDCIGKYADVGYSFGEHLHISIYDMSWHKLDPTPILQSIGVIQ